MEWQPIILAFAASVAATIAVLTFMSTIRARLIVEFQGADADGNFMVSVVNIGRPAVLVVEAGLVAGERMLRGVRVEGDRIPHRLQESEFCSFTLRLAELQRPTNVRVTGAWVRTAARKEVFRSPASPGRGRGRRPRATLPVGWLLTPRARARTTSAIFAVAVVAVLWSFRAPPPECVSIVIASSQEKSSLLHYLALEYNSQQRRPTWAWETCDEVTVKRMASGDVASALTRDWDVDEPRPDVWTPASTTWALLLSYDRVSAGKRDYVVGESKSIARSPLVIGMLEPKARSLGWSDEVRDKTWTEIFDLARNPGVWADYDRSWGSFRLMKTFPDRSTSGLHTLIAQYLVATGGAYPSCTGVASVLAEVRATEAASVYGFETVSRTLEALYRHDQAIPMTVLGFASAVPMEESQLWQYNRGNPAFKWTRPPPEDDPEVPRPFVQLVAFYPADGTLMADHPYIVLDAPWVTPAKKAVAERFLAYLMAPERQALFRQAGFRDERGQLGEGKDERDGVHPLGPPLTIGPPAPDVVRCILDSWSKVRSAAAPESWTA